MIIPHYVNENKSDIRCIKAGWYAMDHDGKLSSGPFASREECAHSITQPTGAEGGTAGGPIRNCPWKDQVS